MTTQRHRYTTQWHIWHDQKWLDDNLEIHSVSSANSGLISYVFFKYHFYNGCHKYPVFPYCFPNEAQVWTAFPATYNTNHLHVRDATQTGWASLPPKTAYSFISPLPLPTAFFPPRISSSLLLRSLPPHSPCSSKKWLSPCHLFWNFLGRRDPSVPWLCWHFALHSLSQVEILATWYLCHLLTSFSWGLGPCCQLIFVFFTALRVAQWLTHLTWVS